MAVGADDLALQADLARLLQAAGNPISYGDLARDLHVAAPGAIGRVTSALEAIMRADAAAGRPFLAAMCKGKVTDGLPARGFFMMAAALGRYSGPATGPEAVAFVMNERALLGPK